MSDTFDIGQAGDATGSPSGFNKGAHIGHHIIYVRPIAQTRTSPKGEEYDVALCDYVLCVDDHRAWSDVPVSGSWLVPRLTSSEHSIVTGKLVQGEASAGKNAPYLHEDATDDEIKKATDIFEKFGVKMPTGKVVFDVDTFHAEPF